MAQPTSTKYYRGKPENDNAVKSTDGDGKVYKYKHTKSERNARQRVYDRYTKMRDDDLRKQAEREWDLGDKMYSMWAPEREEGDWRADVILPDGFSAVQTHLQETIDLRPRPEIEGVESSDADYEHFANSVFQHAMDTTEFDEETHKARNCAAIRGTAFTREEYRYETREVMDPDSYEKGEIKYTKKEIVDYDDVYTRFVENDDIFTDPSATAAKYMNDYIYREVLDYDTFMALYDGKPGFKNVTEVPKAGNVDKSNRFFKKADDVENDDVEVLHYENKLTDSYDVCANGVTIREGPLPNKHKQLTLDVWTFYPQLGRIWGMGIPKIMYTLVEERRSNHNLIFDRGKMQGSKMFLANDLFDIDENDLVPRPHGLIRVNTNGMDIRQAVMPLEYGDIPGSSIRIDDMIKEDERRAHGMSELPAEANGGTAFEAAVIKESTQKRINLVNTLSNWNTLFRLGKKKWSNVQFFYPLGRMERIYQDNKWVNKKVYRTIKIKDMKYEIVKDEVGGTRLKPTNINGTSRLKLDATAGRFMQGDFDIVVRASSNTVVSKPIKQAKVMEIATFVSTNPLYASKVDPDAALKRILQVNDESLTDWIKSGDMTEADMMALADQENQIFANMVATEKIFLLPGTPGATEGHTLQHITFTEGEFYRSLPVGHPVKDIIDRHIAEEHESNPNTGSMADAMAAAAGQGAGGEMAPGGGPEQGGGGNAAPAGQPGGNALPEASIGPASIESA